MRELIASLASSQSLFPETVVSIILMTLGAVVLASLIMVLGLISVYLERKVSAHMQDRVGPMYVGGWHGWLQTLADGVKLLIKEDIVPAAADKLFHLMAPFMIFAATLAAFCVLPFGRNLIFSDLNAGVLYLIAISSFVVVGMILAGWASNNKWSLLGAMRAAAQIVSFEIPASLAVLVIIMAVGSMNLGTIV